MGSALISGVCFFLLLSPFPLAFSERCHPHDKKALLQLKKDLNNPYILASWNPNEDCCEWYCVKCDEKTNRIYDLDISSSVPDTNLSGQIPPSVGDLPYLEFLTFHKLPNLVGPIQPTIAKLTKLRSLFITNTGISGPVPDFLAQLKSLELIKLSFNSLSGTIPSTLYQLLNLTSLQLDRNQLTGPIPGSFGSFKKPGPDLTLSHNQLSGPIPSSLGTLDPQRLDLSRNKLQGDASVLFGSKKRTQILDLSRNLFEFDLSPLKFPPKSLIWLDLNHNNIYGNIPLALTKVENLQQFNVSYNHQLSGSGLEDKCIFLVRIRSDPTIWVHSVRIRPVCSIGGAHEAHEQESIRPKTPELSRQITLSNALALEVGPRRRTLDAPLAGTFWRPSWGYGETFPTPQEIKKKLEEQKSYEKWREAAHQTTTHNTLL
uniref:Polygalacturonase inhibitor n=1 Tax=Cajanus cajan TaxID=3821 RepID=A0A151QNF4_CAJCA|nr:Polygalacturonase inhibitor [Cajanus cajan]